MAVTSFNGFLRRRFLTLLARRRPAVLTLAGGGHGSPARSALRALKDQDETVPSGSPSWSAAAVGPSFLANEMAFFFSSTVRIDITDLLRNGAHRTAVHGGAVERNGFTLNGGAGLKISISDRIYLKVAGLARWFERREADDIDGEITLAAGFQLGG